MAGVRAALGRWLPLLPWLAALPAVSLAAFDATARTQLGESWFALALYLAAWSVAIVGGRAVWRRVGDAGSVGARHHPSPGLVPAPLQEARASTTAPARTAAGWWIAIPLLVLAVIAYWNSAVLDPLQARGFPDYVTQMKGARRLLDGLRPYDPTIRVWTDVNLPPITLLLLFAPFTPLPDLAGKLAYFALNHVAFLAGVALLLWAARPTATRSGAMWSAAVLAIALAFEPWHDSLRLGQQNGIVLLLLAAAAAALLLRWDLLAGGALALALIGKPSAALLGIYFLFARRWWAAAGAALLGLAAFPLTLPWAGVENWRVYLLEKAPEILAGTPQQSNVALLALHARLFLPREALSSFDAMPAVPVAQMLTRAVQLIGLVVLWLLVRPKRDRDDRPGILLEFALALVLSLSLVGHAWQSYTTWLIVAFVPLLDPRAWDRVSADARPWLIGFAGASYAAMSLNDVALFKVVGNTTLVGAAFASAPNVALLVLAFVLACLLRAWDRRPSAA